MKLTTLRSIAGRLALLLGCLFLAGMSRASTVYTLDDGALVIVTVNSHNQWYIQLQNPDSTGSESGKLTQRAAYDQLDQMFSSWGSAASMSNNDGGYSDILLRGPTGVKPTGSYLSMDSYYWDGIGRFDETALPPTPPASYLRWFRGDITVYYGFWDFLIAAW